VYRKAASAGINILPGAVFSPGLDYKPYIRIACGHTFDVMGPAIRKIASLMTT
jgi:DNA-binding transcriptional MocR family regulator